jgi:hypothetical protein
LSVVPVYRQAMPTLLADGRSGIVTMIARLYELNGSGTGYGKTLGYYRSSGEARLAAEALGHSWFDIDPELPALVMRDGEVYLLSQAAPVKLLEP